MEAPFVNEVDLVVETVVVARIQRELLKLDSRSPLVLLFVVEKDVTKTCDFWFHQLFFFCSEIEIF